MAVIAPTLAGARSSRILLNARSAVHLHADLDHASRPLKCLAHAPGVAGIEGHGLFLVDVFAGLDRGDEVQGVLVLGRGDQDRVDVFVIQELAVVA